MTIGLAILLGLIQGITEFIPVSSSGHLAVANFLFGGQVENFHTFLEFINFGTLLALIIFYRKRIWQILKRALAGDWKFALNIIITCIPAGLAGLLLSRLIENSEFFSAIATIAVAMIAVGLIMIFIDKFPHARAVKSEEKLTPKKAFAIGCAQICALVPGVSRSGSTIIAGRLAGLNAKASADYSMLASIPLVGAVVLKSLVSGSSRAFVLANWEKLALSNFVAFAVGLVAIHFLLSYLQKDGALQNFGRYRVVAGVAILILGLTLVA